MLAMDREPLGGRGRGGGRGGGAGRGSGSAAHDRDPERSSGGSRRKEDGYAARPGSGGRSGDGKEGSRTREDFKDYALAVRKRDRRGRDDDPAEPRERGRSHRESGPRDQRVSSGLCCAVLLLCFCWHGDRWMFGV